MGGLWRLNNSSMGFNQPIWIWTNKTMGTLRFDRRKWRIFLDFQTIVKGGLWGVYVCMWLILFGWWHHCIVVAQAFCWGVLVDFGATFRLRPFSRMRLGLVVVVRVYVSVLCWLIWLSGLELLIQSILLMSSAMVFPVNHSAFPSALWLPRKYTFITVYNVSSPGVLFFKAWPHALRHAEKTTNPYWGWVIWPRWCDVWIPMAGIPPREKIDPSPSIWSEDCQWHTLW